MKGNTVGKHKGKKEDQQGTQAGKPWDELTPEEKGREFDASLARPKSYAAKNFKPAKPGEGGKGFFGKAKHKK